MLFPTTEIDVFVQEPFPFDAAYAQATWAQIDRCTIPVASIEHIIALKQQVMRSKDREDILALEEILIERTHVRKQS